MLLSPYAIIGTVTVITTLLPIGATLKELNTLIRLQGSFKEGTKLLNNISNPFNFLVYFVRYFDLADFGRSRDLTFDGQIFVIPNYFSWWLIGS